MVFKSFSFDLGNSRKITTDIIFRSKITEFRSKSPKFRSEFIGISFFEFEFSFRSELAKFRFRQLAGFGKKRKGKPWWRTGRGSSSIKILFYLSQTPHKIILKNIGMQPYMRSIEKCSRPPSLLLYGTDTGVPQTFYALFGSASSRRASLIGERGSNIDYLIFPRAVQTSAFCVACVRQTRG